MDDTSLTFKNHMIKEERVQTKSGNSAIRYRRILPYCGI